MSDTISAPDPLPIVSGPLEDDTSSPSRPTFGEYIGSNATAGWNTATEWARNPAAFTPPLVDSPGAGIGAMVAGWAGAPPEPQRPPADYHPISADDANAQAKAAGANFDIPFTADTTQEALNGMIPDQLARQKAAETTARYAPNIIAQVANMGVGALVSLGDPRNDAALAIPGIGDAWVGERVAQAVGESIAGRIAARTAAGAVRGAEQGIALQPAAISQASQDHQDYTFGDALHTVAMQMFLGAGTGALGGVKEGIFGKGVTPAPDTVNAVAKASVAQTLNGDPVDIQAIVDHGKAYSPGSGPIAANVPEGPMPEDTPSIAPGSRGAVFANGKWVAGDVGTDGGFGYGQLLHGDDGIIYQSRADGLVALKPGEAPPTTPPSFVTDPYWHGQQTTQERLAAQAEQSARDMAQRALSPPADPALVRAQRAVASTIATAPRLEPDTELAETQKMLQDVQERHAAAVANGSIADPQPPDLDPVDKADLNQYAAKAEYAAACGAL